MIINGTGAITPECRRETVAYGLLVLARATSPEWPASVRDAAKAEAGALQDALDLYDALSRDLIHPASEWDDLKGDPEALHTALERAAEHVAYWTAELIRVFPGCEPRNDRETAA
jgi:hypothetical protein